MPRHTTHWYAVDAVRKAYIKIRISIEDIDTTYFTHAFRGIVTTTDWAPSTTPSPNCLSLPKLVNAANWILIPAKLGTLVPCALLVVKFRRVHLFCLVVLPHYAPLV